MLETLSRLDQSLFYLINKTLANPVTDWIMPVVTSDILLRIIYAVAVILLLWKGDKKLRWMVLFSIIALTLTDRIASGLLKPYISRFRPCQVLDGVNLLVGCGSGKSMPSAHAANVFAQAVLFSLHYKTIRWFLLIFAFLVAISRVFVGVHYPGDVIAGALLGVIIGWGVSQSMNLFPKLVNKNSINFFV